MIRLVSDGQRVDLFADIPTVEISQNLTDYLRNSIPLDLAISTEKARSAFIIVINGNFKLASNTAYIDLYDYYIEHVEKILGILWMLSRSREEAEAH